MITENCFITTWQGFIVYEYIPGNTVRLETIHVYKRPSFRLNLEALA